MKSPRAMLAVFLHLAAAAPMGPAGVEETPPGPQPPVVFSEIHYHPPEGAAALEFVELQNRTDSELDLHGWEVRGGIRHRFDRASGPSRIAAKGFLVLARDPGALAPATSIPAAGIAGPFSGKLSNSGDRIALVDTRGVEVEAVEYSRDGAWPARADGLGSSLQRVSVDAPAGLPQNWSVGQGERAQVEERVLLDRGARVRWFESRAGDAPRFEGGVPWHHPGFDDARKGWKDGRLAIGYDLRGRGLDQWISTSSTAVAGLHSILVRIELDAPPDAGAEVPRLFMDWDDGFVAWLNGVEVARGGMRLPAGVEPPWDGRYHAVKRSADAGTRSLERVWTGAPGSIRPGRNVLAIANYNSDAASTDIFAMARITLAPSVRDADITPGAPSAVSASAPFPLVTFLERSPLEPSSADEVVLRARVEGKDIRRVHLVTRVGAKEATVPLEDSGRAPDQVAGDGIYSGTVPPAPSGAVVLFRIAATGAAGGVGHHPREGNPSAFTGYHVLDDPPTGNDDLLVFHMLWTGTLKCGKGVWRKDSVFVHQGTAYLGAAFKLRGDSSCGAPKSGMRIRFEKGARFRGERKLNLLGGWQDRSLLREKIAWDLFRDVGHPYSRAELAAVYARGRRFAGLYTALEDPGEDYLRRNGLDAGSSLWKCRDSLRSGRGGGIGALERLTGAEDETESAALAAFAEKLHSFTGEEHLDFVLREIDVESLIEYQALKCLISDEDGFTKNWLLFHGKKKGAAPGAPALWTAHPWDLDLSFGQIDLFSEDFFTSKHPLLGTAAHPREGRTWNGLLDAVFGGRSGDYFVKALYGRIWSLLDEKFHSRALGPKIDWLDASTIDEARLDLESWPRWGSAPTDPVPHRERLREYVIARGRFLRRFLTAENPTTHDPASRGPFRSYRYTPAPRLRITEIQYHPSVDEDLEFIEVRNLEKRSVDLSGWSIPAVEYVFPARSAVEPGAHFLVARRPSKLAAARGGLAGIKVFGPYEGRLANGGEDLRLRDSGLEDGRRFHPETIDVVKYRDCLPWPPEADGKGKSLELIDVTLDNDRPGSWRASRREGGSPEGD